MNFITSFFSKYTDSKIINWLKLVCKLEALSCFLLYFIAMIWIRYDPENLLATIFMIIVGSLHGLFFSLYILLILPSKKILNWDDEDFIFEV